MALQGSGNISLADIAAEFGKTAPYSLTDFYRGGAWVANSPANAGVPASGSISLTNFYNAAKYLDITGTPNFGSDVSSSPGTKTSNTMVYTVPAGTGTISIDVTAVPVGGTFRYNGIANPLTSLGIYTFAVSNGGTGVFTMVLPEFGDIGAATISDYVSGALIGSVFLSRDS